MNIRKLKGFLRVAGPTICGCLASIGVIVTAVLSAKGALKAEAILHNEELSVKDKVKAAVPDFIPAGVSGVATLGFIFVANVLGEKQRAALAAGFLPMYKVYQERLAVKENPDNNLKGPLTFYDPFGKRYFERTMEEVGKSLVQGNIAGAGLAVAKMPLDVLKNVESEDVKRDKLREQAEKAQAEEGILGMGGSKKKRKDKGKGKGQGQAEHAPLVRSRGGR